MLGRVGTLRCLKGGGALRCVGKGVNTECVGKGVFGRVEH